MRLLATAHALGIGHRAQSLDCQNDQRHQHALHPASDSWPRNVGLHGIGHPATEGKRYLFHGNVIADDAGIDGGDGVTQRPHQEFALYVEAFPMTAARLIVTAESAAWARVAAAEATGYAASVIGCDAEAGLERELTPEETPDGRPGVALLLFAFSRDALQKAAVNRVGPADSTGNARSSYWPGGSRLCRSAAARRPRKPREMIGSSIRRESGIGNRESGIGNRGLPAPSRESVIDLCKSDSCGRSSPFRYGSLCRRVGTTVVTEPPETTGSL